MASTLPSKGGPTGTSELGETSTAVEGNSSLNSTGLTDPVPDPLGLTEQPSTSASAPAPPVLVSVVPAIEPEVSLLLSKKTCADDTHRMMTPIQLSGKRVEVKSITDR